MKKSILLILTHVYVLVVVAQSNIYLKGNQALIAGPVISGYYQSSSYINYGVQAGLRLGYGYFVKDGFLLSVTLESISNFKEDSKISNKSKGALSINYYILPQHKVSPFLRLSPYYERYTYLPSKGNLIDSRDMINGKLLTHYFPGIAFSVGASFKLAKSFSIQVAPEAKYQLKKLNSNNFSAFGFSGINLNLMYHIQKSK